jgi:DNA polymerase-1
MPDYDQMEYRMMLDYARQMDVIEQVKGGMDIHDATAKAISDMLGIAMTRSQAKTLNFGLLYGMGIDALAAALKTTVEKARQLRNAYFQALPFVKGFIRRVTHRAETTGYIFNWTGRRSYFDKKEFCYKAPNALIQGGCCDVLKTAVNLIDDYLAGRKSKILMLVHDEILFEIHESESQICRDLVGIMANVYPHRYLPLSCRFVALELKSVRGKASALQKYKLESVRKSGGLAFEVYPKTWAEVFTALNILARG